MHHFSHVVVNANSIFVLDVLVVLIAPGIEGESPQALCA
jgi:hypothetical protein